MVRHSRKEHMVNRVMQSEILLIVTMRGDLFHYIKISVVNLISLVESFRNNSFGFIEVECRGGIQAYHCRSGSLTYCRLPLSVRIQWLAQSTVDDEKKEN
ncbi:hypothetical protein ALC57_18544 [Trachymyrmex cornetzi]|uniref:Uncharacterized protein n=1 Tax=Trachymyrmex cornetzi TaxID=471704 RepID=A0A151IRJ3_9HYME|nr:hypothetical protein ALC57_18544 [Trachymyrmex cornetzi]